MDRTTTNKLINAVIEEINTLIDWAKRDAEASTRLNFHDEADNDRRRAFELLKVKDALNLMCRK